MKLKSLSSLSNEPHISEKLSNSLLQLLQFNLKKSIIFLFKKAKDLQIHSIPQVSMKHFFSYKRAGRGLPFCSGWGNAAAGRALVQIVFRKDCLETGEGGIFCKRAETWTDFMKLLIFKYFAFP